MKYYLAIDIGASSGRHIVGWTNEQGEIESKEVFRFPNGVHEQDGHLVWDMEALLGYIREGIDKASDEFALESIAIDSWGVDYVLMRGDKEVWPCYAYRDSRTQAVIPKLHEIVPFDELYAHTGCQFQPFNSIYQLYADKLAGRLEGVTDWLMVPEYIMYKLTGQKAREYTNATTSGLINAKTGAFDEELIKRLGFDAKLFPALVQPGTFLGTYKGIKVVFAATHDTGSAVQGIPMTENAPYISSGTWSLLGIKTPHPITVSEAGKANWSNEGGVGYNRFQKNIMGMWLINELRRVMCPGKDFKLIEKEATESHYNVTVDADSQDFLAPANMQEAFDKAFAEDPNQPKPHCEGDYFRSAYLSLAQSYKKAIAELETLTGETYHNLYIVGGGAKNLFLNRLTEEATGKHIVALPIEASALGNLKVQMDADK